MLFLFSHMGVAEKWRPEVIDCERLKISLQFRWGVKGRKGTAMGFPLVFAIAF